VIIGGDTIYLLFGIVIQLFFIFSQLNNIFHLLKFKKTHSRKEPSERSAVWNKHSKFNQIRRLISFLLALAWLGLLPYKLATLRNEGVGLVGYSGKIPFATIADLAPDGVFTQIDSTYQSVGHVRRSDGQYDYVKNGLYNPSTIKVKWDMLAPTVITLRQMGSVQFDDGRVFLGNLNVEYYDTVSPRIARQLAHESQKYDMYRNGYSTPEKWQQLTIPGLDYAVSLNDDWIHTLIMVEGNRIIYITYYLHSDRYIIQHDEYIHIFAECFIKM
jgi:hypothetical protein